MLNRFCRLFSVSDNDQLLVIRIEGHDYSMIEECTCLKGTIIKNAVDFTGENHVKESMEYLEGFNRELAVTQHASLVERIGEFLNPNADVK